MGAVDVVVLGMGRIGGGAYQRLVSHHGMKVLGVDNDPETLQIHQAGGRNVIEGDAVESDFWDKLVICESLKLVLLAMPSHAGNIHALSQLKDRVNAGQFASHIVAIVKYADEVELLRSLGADEVFLVDSEAGSALADDAVAAWKSKQVRGQAQRERLRRGFQVRHYRAAGPAPLWVFPKAWYLRGRM